MTREEAILELETMIAEYAFDADEARALGMAVSTLRPVSREQVEKAWKGDWKFEPDIYDCGTYVCSKCGEPWTLIDGTPVENNMNFCPVCGAAQTDEAVQMVIDRMEGMENG